MLDACPHAKCILIMYDRLGDVSGTEQQYRVPVVNSHELTNEYIKQSSGIGNDFTSYDM